MSNASDVRRARQLKRRIGRARQDFCFAIMLLAGKFYGVHRYKGLVELNVDYRLFIYWLERHEDYKTYTDDTIYVHRQARISDLAIIPNLTVRLVPRRSDQ